MTVDIAQSILEAIDTVVSQRLTQLNFDNTIVCTIVDSTKRDAGEYIVEYQGSTRFTVYSETTYYFNDNQVYVLIPEGDWGKPKTIIGRYKSEDENTPITYVEPSAQIAIAETQKINEVYNLEIYETGSETTAVSITVPIGVDIATISANFKALISDTLLTSGRYGLFIEGYALDSEGNKKIDRTFTLGSVDVFGNPYNLPAPQLIEKNINVKGLCELIIKAYELEFSEKEKTGRVTIQDISVAFGYDIASREDNTVEITGEEPLRYESKPNGTISRTVSLFWFNKDKNNKYLGFTDGEFNEKAKPTEEQIEYDKTYYWIEWEKSDNGGNTWQLIKTSGSEDKITLELSSTASTMVQAYLYINGEKKPSNIITYINEANDIAQSQLAVSLKIIKGNEYALDNYALYGANGVLNNSGDAYTERILSYEYSLPEAHKETIKGSYLASTEDTVVIWRVPVNSTMIAAPKVVEELPESGPPYWILSNDKQYYEYHTKVTSEKDENGKLKSVDLGNMSYRIKNTFEPWAINNTISLEIRQTINGAPYTYTAEKTISFSSFGSSGTNYTFIAKPSRQAYYIGEAIDEALVFELFDKDGNLQKTIESKPDENNTDYIKATTTIEWLDKDTTLITYYPTAMAADAKYSYEGPTFVTYDSFGANPTYYRGALKLHGYEGPITWYAENGEKDINIKLSKNEFIAEFSNFFTPNKDSTIRVWHINAYGELGELLWTQPVLALQNKYGSDLLNNWDGSLTIKEGENLVMAASIVAGTKNNNTFTGVVLGELSGVNASNEKVSISNGLLGFQNGIQTFGFNTDGSAFIGSAGSGRIYFDGDPEKGGIIASQGWIDDDSGEIRTENGTGLKINLKEGSLTSQNFSINASGDATFEGVIRAEDGDIGGWDISPGGIGKIILGESGIWLDARPLSVDENSIYYINCQNYKTDETHKYFRVGKDGSVHATSGNIGGWEINQNYFGGGFENNSNNTYYISRSGWEGWNPWESAIEGKNVNTTNSLYLTDNFIVTTAGKLYAAGAVIDGKITANTGAIGGWTIAPNKLGYWSGGDNRGSIFLSQAGANAYVAAANKEETCRLYLTQNFAVDTNGKMYATGAVIEGTITATEGGDIGGWQIKQTSMGDSTVSGLSSIAKVYETIDAAGTRREFQETALTSRGVRIRTASTYENVPSNSQWSNWSEIYWGNIVGVPNSLSKLTSQLSTKLSKNEVNRTFTLYGFNSEGKSVDFKITVIDGQITSITEV